MKVIQKIETAAVLYRAMDLSDSIPELLKEYKLYAYLLYFSANNSSNDLPYHNSYHTQCMVMNCYEGARYQGISVDDTRILLLAALYHDFNHSGGHFPDDYNIRKACDGLWAANQAVEKLHSSQRSCWGQLTGEELEKVYETIKITKYPYDGPPVTSIQKIIRDADLMQVYETNERRLRKQFKGLKEEVERLQGRNFTVEEWADGCAKFNHAIQWHTDWAARKAIVIDHATCTENLKRLLLEHT